MKTRSLLIGIVAVLGVAKLHAQAEAGAARPPLYVSAAVSYASPEWKDVKDGFGGGLAFGTIIKDVHYLEAEVMYLKFDMEDYSDTIYVDATPVNVHASGDCNMIPVLATYRYQISFGADSKWTMQVGGSVGATMQKLKYTVRATSVSESGSESKWAATLGAQATAVYKVNEIVSVNAGLRGIWTDETDLSDSGFTTLVSAGISFRF